MRNSLWHMIGKRARRVLLISPSVLLAGCQVLASSPPPESRLFANRPADAPPEVAGVRTSLTTAATSAVPAATHVVQRGTINQTLAIGGRVAPARSAQLTLPGGGTVVTVFARSGQRVSEGDPLIEYALDEDSLEAARAQATLAELAAESQQAKVDELRKGADEVAIAQINATLMSDRANLARLQQEQQGAHAEQDRLAQAQTIAQEAAGRQIELGEIAVKAAEDALARAQAQVKQAQGQVEGERDERRLEAEGALEAAAAALRGAERRAELAQIRLTQAQLRWSDTRASHELVKLQMTFEEATADLEAAHEGEAAAREQTPSKELSERQIAATIRSAAAAVRAAERRLEHASLALEHARSTLPAVKSGDDAEVRTATIGLEQAKEDLARTQQAHQRAKQRVESAARPRPSDQASVDAALAGVREAERKVQTEQQNVERLRVEQERLANQQLPPVRSSAAAMEAARAMLAANEARLQALQSNTSESAVKREEVRASLLRKQADAALLAAQPVVVLRAPFDSMLTDVSVTEGQIIAPRGATGEVEGALFAEGAPVAGDRTVAVRLASADDTSVLAEASETDVTVLNVGQPVTLTFPGLAGQSGTGRIVEISGNPSTRTGKVQYPVRVEIDNLSPDVKIGMTAQVSISVVEAQDVLIAPREVVRTVDGQQLVSVVEGDQVRDVGVRTGRMYGAQVELVEGVAEGDVLAVFLPAVAPRR